MMILEENPDLVGKKTPRLYLITAVGNESTIIMQPLEA